MGYRRHRADSNQSGLVELLRLCGVSVVITSQVGGGLGDVVLGFRGKTHLAEIKNGQKWEYTKAQREFRRTWNGAPIEVLTSEDDVFNWVRKHRNG
jgi:hypothetical protein